MNMFRRCNYGPDLGENKIMFHFYKSLKHIIETLDVESIILTLEGKTERKTLDTSYKANRKLDLNDEKYEEKALAEETFYKLTQEVLDSLKDFPITILRHPRHEADDLIHNLCNKLENPIILSTDNDFIQTIQKKPNAKLFNPIRQIFMEAPKYDYTKWKSLKGDPADNIKGVPGVGPKKAEKMLANGDFERLLEENAEFRECYDRCYSLILLSDFSDEEWTEVELVECAWNAEGALKTFKEQNYNSFTDTWRSFCNIFSKVRKACYN